MSRDLDFTDYLLNQHFREEEEREAACEAGLSVGEYRDAQRLERYLREEEDYFTQPPQEP